jgi:hypothetical protein
MAADVKVKTGGYAIPALTSQEFTFWWGADYLPAGYFWRRGLFQQKRPTVVLTDASASPSR